MIAVGFFITIIVISSLSFLLWKKTEITIRKFFWPALILKLAGGISLGVVYTYYYSADDTFLYFDDAVKLSAYGRSDMWGYIQFLWNGNELQSLPGEIITDAPRSVFFVKILSLVNLFTFDNYWISSLWFSFFAFVGSWQLFVRINQLGKDFVSPSVFAFLLLPSCLFWGSGVMKESVAVGSLFFIVGFFLLLYQKRKTRTVEWLQALICTYFLWSLKYYWAAVLFPSLFTCLLMVYFISPSLILKSYWKEIAISSLIFAGLCLGATFIHPNFYLERILGVIVENNNAFVSISEPDDVIHFYNLSPNWSSIFVNAPWALFSGLFRPLSFQSSSFFQSVASIENLFLLVLFVASLKNLRLILTSPYRMLVSSAIIYIVLLCIFLALSTPNFGSLSRYRIGFLPFFTFLIAYRNPLLLRTPFLSVRRSPGK
jgi:hypothetical protein